MRKKDVISLIGIILSIASLFFCIIIIPALITFLAGKYLGFWGALLFTGMAGFINNLAIGLIIWCFFLAIIIKALKKMGIVKEQKK